MDHAKTGNRIHKVVVTSGTLCFVITWEGMVKALLVPRFMGDGECQTQASVFINGAAPVLAAHPADRSKSCENQQHEVQSLATAFRLPHVKNGNLQNM